jgi:tetratricopeptide (TPR) repeat protein
MRPGQTLLISLLCALSLTANAQFEPAFALPLPERIRQIDTLYRQFAKVHSPEEQQTAVVNLRKLAQAKKDDQSLTKAEALQLEQEFAADHTVILSKIDRVFQLIRSCQVKGYKELELWLLIKAGEWLSIAHHLGVGIHYYMQALDKYPGVDSAYWPIAHSALESYVVGGLYSIEDNERARRYMEQSYLMKRTGYGGMRSWDLLSQIYVKLGDYKQSEYYIHEAEKIYVTADTTKFPFEGWRGIFHGYYGKIRYFQVQYKEAIPFFESAVRICDAANQPNNVSSFGILLAHCYAQIGEVNKARALLPRIRETLNRAPEDKTSMDYYNLLLVIGEPRSTPERNRLIIDSLQYWTKQHETYKDSNQLAREELNQEIALYKQSEEQMQKSISGHKTTRVVLLISLALVGLLAIMFVLRKQRQLAHKSAEALEAQAELNQLKMEMLEKIRHIEVQNQGTAPLPDDEALEILKSNPILTDEDWTRFKRLFEKADRGFLDRLKKKYPDLTQGEIRFIALVRLSLTPKEMAALLGVGIGATRTMKSRLLKKLSLHPDENLEEVILSL